jgi:hypothetical protein
VFSCISKVPLYAPNQVHWSLEHKVHLVVGAYSRPMPMSLGPPYERCGNLCVRNPCRDPTMSRQGYLAHKKTPSPLEPPRTLRKGPR